MRIEYEKERKTKRREGEKEGTRGKQLKEGKG